LPDVLFVAFIPSSEAYNVMLPSFIRISVASIPSLNCFIFIVPPSIWTNGFVLIASSVAVIFIVPPLI
jgi:hypothetical protein